MQVCHASCRSALEGACTFAPDRTGPCLTDGLVASSARRHLRSIPFEGRAQPEARSAKSPPANRRASGAVRATFQQDPPRSPTRAGSPPTRPSRPGPGSPLRDLVAQDGAATSTRIPMPNWASRVLHDPERVRSAVPISPASIAAEACTTHCVICILSASVAWPNRFRGRPRPIHRERVSLDRRGRVRLPDAFAEWCA